MPRKRKKISQPAAPAATEGTGELPRCLHEGGLSKRSWRLLWISVVVLWTIAAQILLYGQMPFTGDEPHYLVGALSFWRDHDFNLDNQYRTGQYREYWPAPLSAQYGPYRSGFSPAEHGTVFPMLLAPLYAAVGVKGIRITMEILGFLTCFCVGIAAERLTGSARAGALAAVLLALSITWQAQSTTIYAETLAGLLASLLAVILALSLRGEDASAIPPWRLAAAGFIIVFLPVIYMKYGVLSCGLGLALLSLPQFRFKPALWLGVGLALLFGIANIVLYKEQGAFGGNFTGPRYFSIDGSFQRYWQNFFDQYHGIAVYQPYVLLALWAAIYYIQRLRTDRDRLFAGMAISAILYSLLHGWWRLTPGHSVSGRYYTALLPFAFILISAWALRPAPLRNLRLLYIGTGAAITGALWLDAAWRNINPLFAASAYRHLFPRFTDSLEKKEILNVPPITYLGWYVLVVLVATKMFAMAKEYKLTRTPLRPTLASAKLDVLDAEHRN